MQYSFKTLRYLTGLFLFLLVCISCHNYYKATSPKSNPGQWAAQKADSLENESRYIILRSGSYSWHMNDIVIAPHQNTLSCTLDSVSYIHKHHFTLGRKRKMQYRKASIAENQVLNEVHLYIPPDASIRMGSFQLALDKVQKIEIIEKDRKRTTNSYVIGAIGYTLGAAVIVGIIIAATKSSCPFVSAYDGKEYSLQGEIYGGSVYPQLARHDYLPLKMAPRPDGSLQVKISNELKERQYTDLADLWVITHEKGSRIIPDEKGNLYPIGNPQTAIEATCNGKPVSSALQKAGDLELLYMDDSSRKDARNEVVLRFRKPTGSANGKLLLTLKNSYWLDLLYGELAKGFGTYYPTYVNQQKEKPASELLKWVKEQQIPLEVSAKIKNGWEHVSDITTVGPLATRDVVVPVYGMDMNEDMVEIKLSSGFMFWEIDYAAMDFTEEIPFTIEKLKPAAAKDENNRNVFSALANEDGIYLEQPEIGNVATITYKPRLREETAKERTYILHSKGYYEPVRHFTNEPDLNFLIRFRTPNAFPVYGMQLYQQISSESLQAFAGSAAGKGSH